MTTRWLTAEEGRAWLAYIDLSTLLGDYLDRQLRRDAGITHADYALLTRLSAAPDRSLGMSQLAASLKFTPSRLTHAVRRLEQAGYVQRRSHPTDRRGQLAVLTEPGVALLTRASPGHVEAVRRVVFDVLTHDQVRQFTEVAGTIIQALLGTDGDSAYLADHPWRRR